MTYVPIISLIYCVIVMISLLVISQSVISVDAHIGNKISSGCMVEKNPSNSRINYFTPPRNNPDGSFYPGDKAGFLAEFFIWGNACKWGAGKTGLEQVSDSRAIKLSNDNYGSNQRIDNGYIRIVEKYDSHDMGIDKYILTTTREDVHNTRGTKITVSGNFDVDIEKTNDCHGNRNRAGLEDYLPDYGGSLGYGGEDGWKWGRDIIPNQTIHESCGKITIVLKEVEKHTYGPHKCRHCDRSTFYTTTYHTIIIQPPTRAPITETIFTEHILQDTYGYIAANPDMTNYVWDPIAIQHEATFEFATERAGEISFEYERLSSDLLEEGTGYECSDKSCKKSLHHNDMLDVVGIGFLPYPYLTSNGGGMYAYVAPSLEHLGTHDITYNVMIYNLGRLINTHTNSNSQLVVSYEPVFSHYVYPVLSDGKKYAYDDAQGITILYEGSHGNGPDDNDMLNPERRSRINAIYQNTTSYSEIGAEPIYHNDMLKWDSISHINGTNPDGWLSMYDGVGNGHAMFENDGYGILYLAQELSHIILDEKMTRKFYTNTTTYNNISSDRWAGYDSFQNWNYTYQYPHAPFAQWFEMSAYNPDGTIYNDISLAVNVTIPDVTHKADMIYDMPEIPAFWGSGLPDIQNVVMMLDEYILAKTLHDTNDENFAVGIRDDLYPMTNYMSGNGTILLWMNKTGLEFPLGYVPRGDILGMSRYDAFGYVAGMNIHMTAQDSEEYLRSEHIPKSEIIPFERYIAFDFHGTKYHEKFMLGEGNDMLTSISTDSGLVRIILPEYFGSVAKITLDGKNHDSNIRCNPDCITSAPDGGLLKAYNVWGGSASIYLEPTTPTIPKNPKDALVNNADYMILAGVISIISYLIFTALKNIWKTSPE